MGLTKIRQSGGGTHLMYHGLTDRNVNNAVWLPIQFTISHQSVQQ